MYRFRELCKYHEIRLFKPWIHLSQIASRNMPALTSRYFASSENQNQNQNIIKSATNCLEAKTCKDQSEIFDRTKFEILIRRRFLFDQSYEIYGGANGLFDLGPVGCALKANLLKFWRRFFVLEEQMLEIECPSLTIESVLNASGHIQRFNDYLVKDVVTGESFRLDHLIKSHLEVLCAKTDNQEMKSKYNEISAKLDGKSKVELAEILKEFNIKSPLTGNELTEPIDFNLMFSTQMGPSTTVKGYLRPETSQGIFVNFKRLLDYNHGQLPFSAAQIGNAFRNEISPRGLLRVREFTIAEIEHFLDPCDKSHPKFNQIEDQELILYSACHQMNGESAIRMTIGDAVKSGLVANETLGYFMMRIQQFLLRIGIKPNRLRFRQHMNNEMAHYAVDCWDAECLTSHGWIECVGCADRSAYDLLNHSKNSGANLSAQRSLVEPKEVNTIEFVANNEFLKKFNKKAKLLKKALANLNTIQCTKAVKSLDEKGFFELDINEETTIRITNSDVEKKSVKKTVQIEEFTPNVIEPSFGIGRIMYALLEHSFQKRDEGDGNSYFALSPLIAPHKCAVLPLLSKPQLQSFVTRISLDLIENDISHKVDDLSGSIGRRYIRCDEIGIPISITVDYDTLEVPHTVTVRDRDSKEQLRIPIDDISHVVRELSKETIRWSDLCKKYPKYEKQKSTE